MTAAQTEVQESSDDPGAPTDPRIILVGRTGLEGKLRPFGPVRVRRALDAIGELAEPMPAGGREGPPVVVVGADADPGEGGRAAEFVRALRRVEPAVRILKVGAPNSAPGVYDGTVSADDSFEAMIDTISGRSTSRALQRPVTLALHPPRESPPPEPPPPEPAPLAPGPMAESIAEPVAEDPSVDARFGDAELVVSMLRGLDVAPEAMRLLRDRSGQPGLQFVPADSAAPAGSCPVRWQGHHFGWLAGAASTPADLAPHALWLASWLALAAQQSQLRGEAFSDALTGAWNRRYFERFMEAALQAAQRERRHLTILVFDIDDFKQYNDRFSHAAGDAILVEAVRLLKSVIRPSDKVCRIGGDEFVVIFHEPDGPRLPTSKPPESISGIAKRFQRQICEHRFPKLLEQAPGTLTISGGLATFPWDGRTTEELLARADELALQGKRAGKNTIVFGPGAAEVCGTADD